MGYASINEVWGTEWKNTGQRSYDVENIQRMINQEIRTQTHDSIAQQPNHECTDNDNYLLSTRNNRSGVSEHAGSGVIEGFNGNNSLGGSTLIQNPLGIFVGQTHIGQTDRQGI